MRAGRNGGFKGGKRLQGGWLGAAIGLATSLFGANQAKKQAKKQEKLAQEGIKAMDPYGPYRAAAAKRLEALMADPSSIKNTPSYAARLQAAERVMAAQGYTGSGNALVAAADAGMGAYQQEFSNLALLSGAGVQPGQGYGQALQSGQAGSDNILSGYVGVANNLTNLFSSLGNRSNAGSATFNQPIAQGATGIGAGIGAGIAGGLFP